MDLLKKVLYTIVLVGIGFILGRKTVGEKTVIKYVDLPPIQGEIKVPDLVPKWEGLRDPIKLVYIYKGQGEKVPQAPPEITNRGGSREVDTLESAKSTILDWNTTRKYTGTFFKDPKIGQFDWEATVQYNTLQHLAYKYMPVQVKETRSPRWSPFLRASANSFGQIGAGGGIYYRNFGVDLSYIRDFELTRSGYEIGFSWKF